MNIRALSIAVALALLAVACVPTGSDNAPSPDITVAPQPPTTAPETASWLLVAEPQDDDPNTTDTIMGALIEGTLVIDGDARCVWIDSFERVVVVFRPGTVLRQDSAPEVVMPDGAVFRDGDVVVGGGGLIGPGGNEGTPPSLEHLEVPEACSDASEGRFWGLGGFLEVVESD